MTKKLEAQRLGDLVTIASGGTPSKAIKANWGGDMPWISASTMKKKSLNDSVLKLTEQGIESVGRLAEPGDVLLLVRGSELHNSIPVGIASRRVAFNQDIKSLRCSSSIHNEFLYYWLKGMESNLLNKVESTGIGAGKIDTDVLKALVISLPAKEHQITIASRFKNLDDKIELNRKINETLDQIARALFKCWFVDFDPVQAKAAGRQPAGMDKATADLFPASFVDSELGKIPSNWEVKSVGQIANQLAMGPFGSDIKVSTFVDKGIPVISGQHLRGTLLEDSDYNFVSIEHADRLKRSNVQRGDIVFTHAGSIGQVAYIPETSKYERYIVSQRQFYLRCNRSLVSPFYILSYFKTHEGQHRLLANTSSTGVPSISQPVSYLRQLKIAIPPMDLLERFDSSMRIIYQMQAINDLQARTLSSLRDSLLKKLMAGEIIN